jgi:hypothetical protein
MFHENLTRMTGTLHEGQYTFLNISRSVVVNRCNSAEDFIRLPSVHSLLGRCQDCAGTEIAVLNSVFLTPLR